MIDSIAEITGRHRKSDEPSVTQPKNPARLVALDVLRGIAILGTLGTNIWILTHPEGIVGYINELGSPATGWMWSERVLQQLAQASSWGC